MKETVEVKLRWLILEDNKIFLVQLSRGEFGCLPGGTLEKGEELEQCLAREIYEELWIEPKVGNQKYQQHFMRDDWTHVFDFWYEIKNPEDFKNINLEKASHWYEIKQAWFYDINQLDNLDFEVKPNNLESIINNIY